MKYSSTPKYLASHEDYNNNAMFLDYLLVIKKRKWIFGSICSILMLLTFAISLLMPKIYSSTASVLPQIESKEGGGLGALLAASGAGNIAQSMGIVMPGMGSSTTEIFSAMLKSRVMADDVILRFNLMSVYDAKTMQDAREYLDSATRIIVTKEKVIKVTVETKDPQLAADMANFYVSNLDRLNQTLDITKAKENRKFIERRLTETQDGLVKAEEALRAFQTQNKAFAVEAQATALIESAATIQGQITAQEVQLQVMETYLAPNNPEVMRVRSGVEELKKQLRMMESGKDARGMRLGDRLHPAIVTVPTLALEYGRRMRELKVKETVHSLLTAQYEQAKMAEARDTPTVQVLDRAIPADKKIRPRILLNTLLAGVVGMFLSLVWVFWKEYMERAMANQDESWREQNEDHSESSFQTKSPALVP